MEDDDYAVIIGLQNYPGLDDPANGQPPLSGAENDARDFKEWTASPDGGAVPEQNIKLIVSSDYPLPVENLLDAKPAELEIATAFEKLRSLSEQKRRNHLGSKVGRRLYIFMSGHGIAPTPFGNKIEKEAGLLMANVDPTNIAAPRYHIPGTYTATWFCENECFDQVFLFMDCCRDIAIVSSSNNFLPNKGNADNAIRFYAFATKWSRRAREKIIDGKMQGIFTKTLLLGLSGASAEPDPINPDNGIITGASLKSYLYQNMKEFIDPQFSNEVETQEPDVDYAPKANDGRDIVIKSVPLKKFPVIISVSAGATGKVNVLYNGLTTVTLENSDISNPPEDIHANLSRGTYLAFAIVNGTATSQTFIVKGIEESGKEARVSL